MVQGLYVHEFVVAVFSSQIKRLRSIINFLVHIDTCKLILEERPCSVVSSRLHKYLGNQQLMKGLSTCHPHRIRVFLMKLLIAGSRLPSFKTRVSSGWLRLLRYDVVPMHFGEKSIKIYDWNIEFLCCFAVWTAKFSRQKIPHEPKLLGTINCKTKMLAVVSSLAECFQLNFFA